jgi:hypothetical protein
MDRESPDPQPPQQPGPDPQPPDEGGPTEGV